MGSSSMKCLMAAGAAMSFPVCITAQSMKAYTEVQLTRDPSGHCVNSTQVFSPDDQWIVYDSRNVDSGIMGAGEVAMVHTGTGEIRSLYKTPNQTEFGPGVGAVTFSPTANRVLFIHGIRNATREQPYAMTRRTGVAVDIDRPFVPVFLDARDMTPPFTPGALRGGTHAHTWSGDGKWISYTYNDYLIEQAARSDKNLADLRTIGVMIPGRSVKVSADAGLENNHGEMFSVLIAEVTEHPRPGSDETEKAFDECWIGNDGYLLPDGTRQRRAVAYQGNVRDEKGNLKTEIFVADLPESLLESVAGVQPAPAGNTRLPVSEKISRRRITRLEKGVSNTPRHWLRSVPDGSAIGFLAEDEKGYVQLHTVSPNGGEVRKITSHPFSVAGPFNISPDGKRAAYVADNSIFITELATGKSERVTPKASEENRPHGAVIWSNKGAMLCFNRYVKSPEGNFLQVFLLK